MKSYQHANQGFKYLIDAQKCGNEDKMRRFRELVERGEAVIIDGVGHLKKCQDCAARADVCSSKLQRDAVSVSKSGNLSVNDETEGGRSRLIRQAETKGCNAVPDIEAANGKQTHYIRAAADSEKVREHKRGAQGNKQAFHRDTGNRATCEKEALRLHYPHCAHSTTSTSRSDVDDKMNARLAARSEVRVGTQLDTSKATVGMERNTDDVENWHSTASSNKIYLSTSGLVSRKNYDHITGEGTRTQPELHPSGMRKGVGERGEHKNSLSCIHSPTPSQQSNMSIPSHWTLNSAKKQAATSTNNDDILGPVRIVGKRIVPRSQNARMYPFGPENSQQLDEYRTSKISDEKSKIGMSKLPTRHQNTAGQIPVDACPQLDVIQESHSNDALTSMNQFTPDGLRNDLKHTIPSSVSPSMFRDRYGNDQGKQVHKLWKISQERTKKSEVQLFKSPSNYLESPKLELNKKLPPLNTSDQAQHRLEARLGSDKLEAKSVKRGLVEYRRAPNIKGASTNYIDSTSREHVYDEPSTCDADSESDIQKTFFPHGVVHQHVHQPRRPVLKGTSKGARFTSKAHAHTKSTDEQLEKVYDDDAREWPSRTPQRQGKFPKRSPHDASAKSQDKCDNLDIHTPKMTPPSRAKTFDTYETTKWAFADRNKHLRQDKSKSSSENRWPRARSEGDMARSATVKKSVLKSISKKFVSQVSRTQRPSAAQRHTPKRSPRIRWRDIMTRLLSRRKLVQESQVGYSHEMNSALPEPLKRDIDSVKIKRRRRFSAVRSSVYPSDDSQSTRSWNGYSPTVNSVPSLIADDEVSTPGSDTSGYTLSKDKPPLIYQGPTEVPSINIEPIDTNDDASPKYEPQKPSLAFSPSTHGHQQLQKSSALQPPTPIHLAPRDSVIVRVNENPIDTRELQDWEVQHLLARFPGAKLVPRGEVPETRKGGNARGGRESAAGRAGEREHEDGYEHERAELDGPDSAYTRDKRHREHAGRRGTQRKERAGEDEKRARRHEEETTSDDARLALQDEFEAYGLGGAKERSTAQGQDGGNDGCARDLHEQIITDIEDCMEFCVKWSDGAGDGKGGRGEISMSDERKKVVEGGGMRGC